MCEDRQWNAQGELSDIEGEELTAKTIPARGPVPEIRGVGVGLRACHYPHILTQWPEVPWFEIQSDNYMVSGGPVLGKLDLIAERYPIAMHSVGLSLGSVDPLSKPYLSKLLQLSRRINPAIVSDHLCWTSFGGQYFHELLPLPYTEEALSHVARRIEQAQDFLGRRLAIENVSSYLSYRGSGLTEWEFLEGVASDADCNILLDINNIYVSSRNHRFDPDDYLRGITPSRVVQFHLAGFQDCGTHLLDNHGAQVSEAVWSLYERAVQRFGPVPTSIEWDVEIPEFQDLLGEARTAASIGHTAERPTPDQGAGRDWNRDQ